MRTTKLISISIPPQLLKKADSLAQEEDRTRSAIFREALRLYIQKREECRRADIYPSREIEDHRSNKF